MFLVQKRHLSIPEFYLKTQKNRQKLRKKANKNRNLVEKHIKNGYNKIMMIFVTSCYVKNDLESGREWKADRRNVWGIC